MKGLGISEGIVIGRAFMYQTDEPEICKLIVNDYENEIIRFDEASKTLISKLKLQQQKAEKSGDKERADVFVAHELIVDDPELIQGVRGKIKEHNYCVEWALNTVCGGFINMMGKIEVELKE
ncbi:MAG: phosphoenolpyruvate-utilizing N-terminal domain-containing protein [Alkaliphilus sp.]